MKISFVSLLRVPWIPEEVTEDTLPPWACCWKLRDTVLGLDIYDIKVCPLMVSVAPIHVSSGVCAALHSSYYVTSVLWANV
eukprot:scaffold390269_cov19-Prasinocladus_malaysianus.AAC.1